MDERIGGDVRALRLERGLSLRETAAGLGVTEAWLALAEHGHRPFSAAQLAVLCRVLGVPQFVITADAATVPSP